MSIKRTIYATLAVICACSAIAHAASERIPFTTQTASAAPESPSRNINDGSGSTSWSALSQNTLANNLTWIQADLGTRRRIDRIQWTSPSPASALANYAIKTSDDGKNWTVAAAQFSDADAAVPTDRVHPIDRDARYVRIETTKIGDGSGRGTASVSELTVWGEAARTVAPPFRCDKTLGPSDYVAELEAEKGNTDGSWKNICLQGGNYSQPVKMRQMRNVRLLAQDGGVVFRASQAPFDFSKFPKCVSPPGSYTSVVSISESQDVLVKGLTIHNEFVGGDYRKVLSCGSGIASSRAVTVSNSRRIRFEDTSIISAGKNTLTAQSSDLVVVGGSITGWYFIADPHASTVYFRGVKFTQRENPQIAADTHTMFSTGVADVVLDDSSFTATSGNGFLGGSQVAAASSEPDTRRKWVLVGNNTANVSGWLTPIPLSSGYKNNVQLFLTGTYPALAAFTRINELIEPGTGDRVCSFSPAGALLSCAAPELPVVADAEPAAAGPNILSSAGATAVVAGLTSYRGGTIAADAAESKSGSGSVKVSTAVGSGGISQSVPAVAPGKRYVFSFWAKAASAGGTINWNMQTGKGDFNCLYGTQIPLSTTWKNYSKTCVLDAVKPRLLIYSHNSKGPATFWVDDIKLRLATGQK